MMRGNEKLQIKAAASYPVKQVHKKSDGSHTLTRTKQIHE